VIFEELGICSLKSGLSVTWNTPWHEVCCSHSPATVAFCPSKQRMTHDDHRPWGMIKWLKTESSPKNLVMIMSNSTRSQWVGSPKIGLRPKVEKSHRCHRFESITKLSRSNIDDRRSTIILRRCNQTDRRYRQYSPVGGIEPTVNIDRS